MTGMSSCGCCVAVGGVSGGGSFVASSPSSSYSLPLVRWQAWLERWIMTGMSSCGCCVAVGGVSGGGSFVASSPSSSYSFFSPKNATYGRANNENVLISID
eukprot:220182_1